MKRFLVFAHYEMAEGGWKDFLSDHERLADAKEVLLACDFPCGHVVDLETRKIVF